MICSFKISPHRFIILEKSFNDNYYIKVERVCRTVSYDDMIQDIPKGALMGYDTQLSIKHLGKPLTNCNIKLYHNTHVLEEHITDHKGTCLLNIDISRSCECAIDEVCNNVLIEYILEVNSD